jgi:hypothetical protein
LYAYLRRRGYSADLAQDLILCSHPRRVERGRFRFFLLGFLKFLWPEKKIETRAEARRRSPCAA